MGENQVPGFDEMRHEEICERIEACGMYGSEPGVELAARLLEELDHPGRSMKIIHIAGTNGKGSTVFYTEALLSRLGFRIGVITSPHFTDMRERIRMDGGLIPAETFDDIAEEVLSVAERMPGYEPTMSDVLLAVGLMYFEGQQADYVILETGLGGRLDSTTAVTGSPEICAITHIGLDHTALLGNTIEAIAAEKAGIIKANAKVIVAENPRSAVEVIEKRCREAGTDCRCMTEEDSRRWGVDGMPSRISATYQRENLTTALGIISALGFEDRIPELLQGGFPLGPAGRLYVTDDDPLVIVDGAHNPDGAAALANALEKGWPNRRFLGVVGILRDKDAAGILQAMAPQIMEAYTVTVGSGRRRTDADALMALMAEMGITSRFYTDCQSAFEQACLRAKEEDLGVVVFGSLELAGMFVE